MYEKVLYLFFLQARRKFFDLFLFFIRQINCLCVFVVKINLPLATGFFFKGSKAFF